MIINTELQQKGNQFPNQIIDFTKEVDTLYFKTENHIILVDLRRKNITGKDAENSLIKADITVNKNMVPFDDKSPFVTSGMRIGTPAITTRGLKEADMTKVVDLIDTVISNNQDESKIAEVKSEVNQWMSGFPLFDA